jgi:tetratricopeptide (TPR) repeat protein
LPVPERVEIVLRKRIDELRSEDDEQLLSVGAVQGRRFLAQVVATNLEQDEFTVVGKRLEAVAKTHGLIHRSDAGDWFEERSDVYDFEHALLQRELYERLAPRARKHYHALVATALEVLIESGPDAPRRLVLELAQHCERAGRLTSAARHLVAAGHSAFRQGALDEAAELGLRAITTLDRTEGTLPENDQVLIEAVELVLGAAATGWRGATGVAELDALGQRGEEAATRAGDRRALARLRFMRGDREVQLRGLDSALKMLGEAVELAREAGDPVTEFTALTGLGHQTASKDLTRGVAVLREAQALGERLRASGEAAADEAWLLDRHLLLLRGLIGIGEFDTGDYGTALTELNAVVSELERRGARWDIGLYCAFLAQVRTATGAFKLSEEVLNRGIAVIDEPYAYRAYCQALLGKLYVEWERPDDAREPAEAGLAEAEALGHLGIVPLMRNYVGELYMDEHFAQRDLDVAQRHLDEAVAEAKKAGSCRAAVTALSLQARLQLKRDDPQAALERSSKAVAALEEHGDMPAVRAEEILYTHHCVLETCGDAAAAARYLTAARDKLDAKAATLDAALRPDFLERVPVSRAILAARPSG